MNNRSSFWLDAINLQMHLPFARRNVSPLNFATPVNGNDGICGNSVVVNSRGRNKNAILVTAADIAGARMIHAALPQCPISIGNGTAQFELCRPRAIRLRLVFKRGHPKIRSNKLVTHAY
jgi:hypothetical protein